MTVSSLVSQAFEAYLEEYYRAAIDLNFLKAALEYRDQLYISKEHERKVALGTQFFLYIHFSS